MKHLYKLMVGCFLILSVILQASWAPPIRAADRPNFLFIIFDDMSWNTAGAYGCQWVNTPNIDRVAREGVRFEHAFTSNPKCSPCRASILTGRNTWQLEELSVHNSIFPKKWAVFPDLLEASGYDVGLTGKGWGPGDYEGQGWTRNPAGPSWDRHTLTPAASGISKDDYAKNFETFLDQRKDPQAPFSFWMGFKEPHRAYELHSGVRLGKDLAHIAVPPYLPDIRIVRSDLADYAVEVESADKHIGRALELLEQRGILDNTLVIVTSDHGMPFPYVKGQIHEDGFRLPLVARWGKAVKPGRVVKDFINVRDIMPTLLELAGLEKHPQITGASFVPLLTSDRSGWLTEDRNVMLVGKERHDLGRPNRWGYPVRAIRTTDYLYVHNYHPERWPACNPETNFGNCDDGPTKDAIKLLGGYYFDLSLGFRPAEELYRLKDDPHGVRNLANDLAYVQTLTELRARMLAMLTAEGDPRALGNGAVFDTYEYVKQSAKDFDAWVANQGERLSEEVERGLMDKKKTKTLK